MYDIPASFTDIVKWTFCLHKKHHLVDMDDDIDFTHPWAHSDIIFLVEEEDRVFANKTILAMWSPVMHAMFQDDFKEKNATEIELPGKVTKDFIELMKVIHPPNKEIDGTNVCQLLPLSEEYQMTKIKERCEKYLLSQSPSVHSLVLAENFNLVKLKRGCVQYAKNTSLSQLQAQPDYDKINPAVMVEILTHKVERLEAPIMAIKCIATHIKPNTSKWCPAVDSRDIHNRHDLGAKKACMHCNSYNFEQIERVCAKLKLQ